MNDAMSAVGAVSRSPEMTVVLSVFAAFVMTVLKNVVKGVFQ